MKVTSKNLLLAASLTLFSGGYQASAFAADMNAEAAITAAKDARAQAGSVGGEWRDTGKMIARADALLKEGKND
jgi:hypothetical protein